jgi:holo-[acyl-carrier protein] synthase
MQHVRVDIVEIPHIEKVIQRWGNNFLERVFTPKELKLYCNTRSIAARFAAKEVVLKALGVCGQGISCHEIEFFFELNGKPLVNLTVKPKLKADESAISRINISLSHSEYYAMAS